jgi:hypothetical protein
MLLMLDFSLILLLLLNADDLIKIVPVAWDVPLFFRRNSRTEIELKLIADMNCKLNSQRL